MAGSRIDDEESIAHAYGLPGEEGTEWDWMVYTRSNRFSTTRCQNWDEDYEDDDR